MDVSENDVTQQRRAASAGFIRPPERDTARFRAGRTLSPQTRVAVAARREAARLPARTTSSARPPIAGRRQGRGPWPALFIGLSLALLLVGARAVTQLGSHASTGGSAQNPPASSHNSHVDSAYLTTWQNNLGALVAQQGPPTYAVLALDLDTGTSLSADADTPYRAASVNKLELAIDLYHRAQQHQFNLDATRVVTDAEIQHYGTGTIQLAPGPQTFTYRDLVKLMIGESDNTAAYVIGNDIGLGNVQSDIQNWGLTHTSMAGNTTTARDTALLLQKLAKHTLLSASASEELIGYLENTAWTDRVQSGVPDGVPVAHKIGTDVDVFNDAAIVYNGDHPYVLVVLGSGAGENDGLQAITAISKQIWQFEQGLPGAMH